MSGLSDDDLARVDALLADADEALATQFPGPSAARQPVHTLYVPADRITESPVADLGAAARAVLAEHAPQPGDLARAVGTDPVSVAEAWPLLLAKLETEPVEDLRIDLEDGYRGHDEEEERRHAVAAVRHVAAAPPPTWGVRFRSLEAATRRRGLRTLDVVLTTAVEGGGLPDGFRVTLPKVTSVDQVRAMVDVCERLERGHGLASRSLVFEVQVETAQAVVGPDGTVTAARLVHAAGGRCVGLHFGTYDYTASLGIPAAHQALDHPAADHAKELLQVAAAGTGVPVSDGSTNRLPVGSRQQVHEGWALHFRLVRRALARGLMQGWDLHPAQLPTRYLATYLFFREGLDAAAHRLRDYLGGAAGSVADEPATATALAAFLRRGVQCGALTQDEVAARSGADAAVLDELALRRIV